MAKISVTVVIVSYKSAHLSVDALQSVQEEQARYPDLDIKAVVVDNAAGDTLVIADAIKERDWSAWATVLTAPKNGGFGYGNNYGFAYALAHWPVDYFHILNPDTQVRAGAIDKLVQFLENHANAGVAGSSFETSDGAEWPYAFRFPSIGSEIEDALKLGFVTRLLRNKKVPMEMGDKPERVDWLSGASMMIKAPLAKILRGFDESYFLYFEETDLFQRVKEAGYESWYVPDSRVMHILGQSTKVTEITDKPKRLPTYWFESRTNYFLKNNGLLTTLMIDAVVVIACGFNAVKRWLKAVLLNKQEYAVPYFVRDLLANSAWRPSNRVKKAFISAL